MTAQIREMLMELKEYLDSGYATVEDAEKLHEVGFALPAHDGKCRLELEVYTNA